MSIELKIKNNLNSNILKINSNEFEQYYLLANKNLTFKELYFSGDLDLLKYKNKVITIVAANWNEHSQQALEQILNWYPNCIFLMSDFAKFEKFANEKILEKHKLITVLANGIKNKANEQQNLLLMSSFKPNTHCYKINFLIRNCLIAQLSDILFVINVDKKLKIYNLISQFIDNNKEVCFLDQESANKCSEVENIQFDAIDWSKNYIWS